jgi:hypothetical protein
VWTERDECDRNYLALAMLCNTAKNVRNSLGLNYKSEDLGAVACSARFMEQLAV